MTFNKFRNLLTFLIVCILLMQTIVFAESNNDLKKTENIREAKILLALDIMDGFNEETYQPDSPVTRAEFAVYITKLLDMYNSTKDVKGGVIFSDVKADYWAAQSITFASSLGIVKGFSNGTFRPEESVTYEQAIKFIVSTLGYDVYAQIKGGYPYGYIAIASEKGILKNVVMDGGKSVKLSDAIKMIYNALDVALVTQTEFSSSSQNYNIDKDKTLLSEKLNIYKKTGKLTATSITKLTGVSNLNNDEVKIDEIVYKVGKLEVEDLLGYKIQYYYKVYDDSDDKTLLYVEIYNHNDTILIKSEDINFYTDKVYSYTDQNGGNKTAKFSVNADIIFNGKAKPDCTTFVPANGNVLLVDSEGSGSYDLVKINDYSNCVVKSINEADDTVYDKYGTVNKLVLDPTDTTLKFRMKNKNGASVKITELVEGDVLSYTRSEDINGKYLNITLSKDKIEGKIDELSNDGNVQDIKVTINGKEYGLTNEYFVNLGVPQIGDEGVFHFDAQGKIASLDKTGLDYISYAYLVKADIAEKSFGGKIKFKLFNSDGEFAYYNSADKIKIDGDTDMTINEALTRLGYPTAMNQPISYELNSKGEISKIDTVNKGSFESDDTLRLQYESTSVIYKGGTLTFAAKFCMTTSTVIFNIPTDLEDEDGYALLSGRDFSNDKPYAVKAYSSKLDTPTVNVVVTSGAGSVALDGDTPITIVKKITQQINGDGEIVNVLYGNSEGKDVQASTSLATSNLLNGIKIGDAIRFGLDTKKQINNVILIYSAQDDSYRLANNPSSSYFIEFYRFMFGMVYSKSNGYIRVAKPADILTASDYNLETYQAEKFKIVVCEVSNTGVKLTNGSMDDFVEFKRSGNDCSKVLIQTRYGDPKAIYIFKKVQN